MIGKLPEFLNDIYRKRYITNECDNIIRVCSMIIVNLHE